MAIDLHELINSVSDESSFLRFVEALGQDKEEEDKMEAHNPSSPFSSGALGWENGSIGSFLESAHAWGVATANGSAFYEKPNNPWRRAAQILHAGKFYE